MLACHIKGVQKNYPFLIEAVKIEERDADYDPDSNGLLSFKARKMGCREGLPETVSSDMLHNDDFLRKFHHALLEVTLEEGALICPETGRRFPVSKGIPNMLLNEDEC
ncbi:uncharacterized protein HaLaN_07839 [Haematococcus lacustris]|uniref:Uncharacterized protein n=1 Tax=Haematococcus lacustris TaxID=44745 RepID=A0A699YQN3_HAELA|nr:uncharacterized protein HaLaN_07839 [Haematococcus lacustris]